MTNLEIFLMMPSTQKIEPKQSLLTLKFQGGVAGTHLATAVRLPLVVLDTKEELQRYLEAIIQGLGFGLGFRVYLRLKPWAPSMGS